MELKEYQQRTLKQVDTYLRQLAEWKKKADDLPDAEIDFPAKAWAKLGSLKKYQGKENGLGQPLPNFCLKIPTGGGKTLLAVKALDLIHTHYLRRQTGLVLWVVPTTQIYRQTYVALKDRAHPYRQHMDMASGNRTMIIERTERFTPRDVQENLVVLMLMLPAAARQNKDTLRMFRDSGGFQEFFPQDDDIKGHTALLERCPNLDAFGNGGEFWHKQVKTSLGNTLRLLSPVIILDEGQKAYSDTAQETLCGFNPCMVVELSATPPQASNVLVDIRGRELDQEEMIKLDLHIRNQASHDWQDTLQASVLHLEHLQKKADECRAATGTYIRPIMLIQVERTGKDQRDDKRHTHAEQIKEHLMRVFNIPEQDIAIKTSDKDELKDVDDVGGLLSDQCPIRFIITKQALQEGWDCSFAYILTILTNPGSRNALTQLVGRILRQPGARKLPAPFKELNESYVYTYQLRADTILKDIKQGFELDGLGDLAGRVSRDDDTAEATKLIDAKVRPEFQRLAQTLCLPMFAIRDGKNWRPVSYEMDIAQHIEWEKADLTSFGALTLSAGNTHGFELNVRLGDDLHGHDDFVQHEARARMFNGGMIYDPAFMARQLCVDIVPNPWVAYQLGKEILEKLKSKNGIDKVVSNYVYIVQEAKKLLLEEKHRLAKQVFEDLLKKDAMRFMVITEGFDFSKPHKVKDSTRLTRKNGEPVQRSLFDPVMVDDFNNPEREVAWFLDEQEELFCWYRNVPKQDYFVQGWQRYRIFPDFIFTTQTSDNKDDTKVFVVELKGIHLKNEDTDYKQTVFEICNQRTNVKQTDFASLNRAFKQHETRFEVIYDNEWQKRLSGLLSVAAASA